MLRRRSRVVPQVHLEPRAQVMPATGRLASDARGMASQAELVQQRHGMTRERQRERERERERESAYGVALLTSRLVG